MMSRQMMNSYRWDGHEWIKAIPSSQLNPDSQPVENANFETSMENIRIATFNILADCFPWFIELATRSPERFEWLHHAIAILNPTILGLNEVTLNALRHILESSFIRNNYFIATTLIDCQNLADHGCILLSKFSITEAFTIPVTGSIRDAVVGKICISDRPENSIHFCALHTTAYQTPKNSKLRAQQIHDVVCALTSSSIPFIIAGDLNLHYIHEDAVIIDHNLIDAWAQTHFSDMDPFNDQNPGYTFDSIQNTFIQYYIPGEHRQMRLDRILFSDGFPAVSLKPCAIWANNPIRQNYYLYPSDHFGLYIDISFGQPYDKQSKAMPLDKLDPRVLKTLRRHTQIDSPPQAYQLPVFQRVTALISHVIWLGATMMGLK